MIIIRVHLKNVVIVIHYDKKKKKNDNEFIVL